MAKANVVYLGLGANLGQPEAQIQTAISALATISECELLAQSRLYASKPMGPQDQPDYINAVVALVTTLSPLQLLAQCQQIEQRHGRVRDGERWQARTLDIDILLFGNEMINEPELQVPHYGMHERAFVLLPLFEIRPDLCLPTGERLSQLIANIEISGIQPCNPATAK